VTAWLARDHPQSVAAIHLATPSLVPLDPTRSEPEGHYARAVAEWTAEEGGYMHEQATKPTTLAAALSDSPAGLAAWIGEKALNWSSEWSDGAPAFDRELLLSTLTLYWTTNPIAGSLLPYWAHRHADGALPPDAQSPVPTTITIFGGERVAFPKPPRGLAERYYTVSGWAEHPVGGHFPAIAEPDCSPMLCAAAFAAPAQPDSHPAEMTPVLARVWSRPCEGPDRSGSSWRRRC
jgi:pimeloyl-ACP methyl ester carboxylesterase